MQYLASTILNTPLGEIKIVADESQLYVLKFTDSLDLDKHLENLSFNLKIKIIPGKTDVFKQIFQELDEYFSKKKLNFTTPTRLTGSNFQHSVWRALQNISAGKTCSYLKIAEQIGKPKSFRAVANACRANPLAIVIPCHRVIKTSGELGGYNGGAFKKSRLLKHELIQ